MELQGLLGERAADLEIGEFGIGALVAGEFGVPALYLSGDDKAAAEAEELVPGIVTTVVKTGVRREAARFVPPVEARARMAPDVEAALRDAAWPQPLDWSGEPLRLTFTRAEFCDLSETCPGTRGWTAARWRSAAPRSPRCTRGSSPACGSRSARADAARSRGAAGTASRPASLRACPRCGQIIPSSGCGAAGSTSASQAEDRGFESRHPLQSFLLAPVASARPLRPPFAFSLRGSSGALLTKVRIPSGR